MSLTDKQVDILSAQEGGIPRILSHDELDLVPGIHRCPDLNYKVVCDDYPGAWDICKCSAGKLAGIEENLRGLADQISVRGEPTPALDHTPEGFVVTALPEEGERLAHPNNVEVTFNGQRVNDHIQRMTIHVEPGDVVRADMSVYVSVMNLPFSPIFDLEFLVKTASQLGYRLVPDKKEE